MYFTSLRENFKQVLPVWLGVLVFTLIASADLYFIVHFDKLAPTAGSAVRGVLIAGLSIMTVIVVALVQWYTILQSRYSNTNKQHLKNALLASIGFFPQTVMMLVLLIGTAVASIIFYGYALPAVLLVGISLPQYCCALIYTQIFPKLDGDDAARS